MSSMDGPLPPSPPRLFGMGRIVGRLRLFSPAGWVAAGLILGAALALHVNLSGLVTDRVGADFTFEALRRVNAIGEALADAEAGQRGFLLTGDDAYLAPYERALATLADDLAAAL